VLRGDAVSPRAPGYRRAPRATGADPEARICGGGPSQLILAIDAITGRVADAVSVASWAPHAASPSNTTLSGAAGAHSRSRAIPAHRPGRAVAILAAAAAVVIAVAVRHRSGDAPALERNQGHSTPEPGASPPPVVPSPSEAAAPPTQAAGDSSAEQPASVPMSPPEPPASRVRTPPQAPQTPSIELTIDSDPPGAQIVVADRVLGTTPFHRTLARHAGELTIVVRLAGYRNQTMVVDGGEFP
jgi:hypothetical protein